MAKTLSIASRFNLNVSASTTTYTTVGDFRIGGGETVETNTYITYRTGGTFTNLYLRMVTNDRAASTFSFRVNAAAGNMSVSTSAAGEFEDTTNSDTVVAGDEVAYKLITGAGGTAYIASLQSVLFAASSNTVKKFAVTAGTVNGTSATLFQNLSGGSLMGATEAAAQIKLKTAGTGKNLFVNVIAANGRSTTTTLGVRKNNANGNMSVSYAAGVNGITEDTSNSDTLAVNDTYGYYGTVGTGTGNMFPQFAVDYETTDSTFFFVSSASTTVAVLAGVTTNFALGGLLVADTTEANWRADANIAMTITKAEAYLTASTIVEASTLKLRINGANGNLSVSLTGLTAGWFEDASNSDTIAATDELNWQIIVGPTGTSLSLAVISCLATTTAVSTISLFQLLGVGT